MDEAHSRRAASKADKWTDTGGFPLPLTKDATLPPALPPPACLFRSSTARTPSSALGSAPPHPSLTHSTCPGAVTDRLSEFQVCVWQRALGSCSSCSPRAAQGIAQEGGGEERQLPTSPPCVHSTQGSNLHTGLPCFAFPSASTASSLLLPPRACFSSRQPQPPVPSTQSSFVWVRWMPVQLWVPSSSGPARAIHPKRHPGKTLTCKLSLVVSSTLHCTSIKVNKPETPLTREALEITTASWEKKYYEKNQRGELIEPAAVCSTYDMSQSSCCCTGFFFFTRDEQAKAVQKPEQSVYSAHPWLCFHPTGNYVFSRT